MLNRTQTMRAVPKTQAREVIAALCAVLAAIAVLAAAAAGPTSAQEGASATIEPASARVGERVTLILEVLAPPGSTVELDLATTDLGGAEVAEALPLEAVPEGDLVRYRLRYLLTAFAPGAVEVRPSLLVTAEDGPPEQVAIAPVSWEIVSVLPPGTVPTEIRDLRPQLSAGEEGFAYARQATAGGIAAGAVAALLAAAFLLRRFGPFGRERAEEDLPPHVIAERELEALSRIAPVPEALPGIYARIARIIRSYLTGVYGFPAVALTTGELEEQMVDRGVNRWQARLVSGLLKECDAVTYASYRPAPARVQADVQMAYEIVSFQGAEEASIRASATA